MHPNTVRWQTLKIISQSSSGYLSTEEILLTLYRRVYNHHAHWPLADASTGSLECNEGEGTVGDHLTAAKKQ